MSERATAPLVKLSDRELRSDGNIAKSQNSTIWVANFAVGFFMYACSYIHNVPQENINNKWLCPQAQQTAWVCLSDIPTKSRFKISRSSQEVEEMFDNLLAQWRKETATQSNYSKIMASKYFRQIISIGPQIVPLILKDMKKGRGGLWFQALEDLTGENPIAPEHEVDSALMIADWLAWGTENGLI